MEVFRFAVYVMGPVAMFYYFNLPDFYNKHVRPFSVSFFFFGEWGRRKERGRK